MWLVSDLTPADIDHPQPGTVIAGRIEADHLGEPFKLGAMLIMQVLEPAARVSVLQRPEVGPVAGAWLERWEAPQHVLLRRQLMRSRHSRLHFLGEAPPKAS
jgi:hypothetical protein